jgi:hypothetical protein
MIMSTADYEAIEQDFAALDRGVDAMDARP